MKSRMILLLVIQVFLLTTIGYANDKLHIEQRLWLTDISANGRYVSPAGREDICIERSGNVLPKGTGNLDLQKDLGLKKSNLPQTRIIWDISDSQSVRLDYFAGRFTGNTELSTQIPIGIFTREIKAHADETLDMKFWKAGWINYGSSRLDDKIRFGFLFDIKTVSMCGAATLTSVMNDSSPITLQSSWRITDPTLGFVISGKPNDRLNYFIECAGLTNGKNGFMFADYEANINWYLDANKNTSLVAGYHVINYDNYRKTQKSKLDNVRIAGAFYGVETRF